MTLITCASVKTFLSTHVIDFVCFSFYFGIILFDLTCRSFIPLAICLDIYRSDEICKDANGNGTIEKSIQTTSAMYLIYYKILLFFPNFLLGIYCGVLGDRYSRIIPLLFPCVGGVLGSVPYLASTTFFGEKIKYLLIGSAIQGMFGGTCVMVPALFGYASDTTTQSNRTTRFGTLESMQFLGQVIGSLMSGILQEFFPVSVNYLVSSVMHTIVFLTVIFLLKETVTFSTTSSSSTTCMQRIMMIFDSMKILYKKRENCDRFVLLLLFISLILDNEFLLTERDITMLFVQSSPLNWRASWYGYLFCVDNASTWIGLVTVLPFLSGKLGLSDDVIIIIGLSLRTIRLSLFGFCTRTWMVYTFTIIGSFGQISTAAIRSRISKLVQPDEVGQVFSVTSVIGTVFRLSVSAIYLQLYTLTFSIHQSIIYLIRAGIYFIILFIYLVFLTKSKNVSLRGNEIDMNK